MELCLVDDKVFVLSKNHTLRIGGKLCVMTSAEDFTLEPLVRYYCKPLLDSDSVSHLNATDAQDEENATLQLEIEARNPLFSAKKDNVCRMQIINGHGTGVLERIRKKCGDDHARINLKLNSLANSLVDVCFEARDLPIKELRQMKNRSYGCGYGCKWEMSDFDLFQWATTRFRLTVSLQLSENAATSLLLHRFPKSKMTGVSKRLLEDAVCSDLVIVAANGKEIKCHKAMLAVHSDSFKTMFENEMKESITNIVEMRDTSEQAARAMLGFIYCWDIKEAVESCSLALELLVVAEKYNISDLLSAIVELIAFMPNEWFNMDMSLELLIFTERRREICENRDFEQLQEKVIQILKSYSKASFDILWNSDVYQQLVRNEPETAIKIRAHFPSE